MITHWCKIVEGVAEMPDGIVRRDDKFMCVSATAFDKLPLSDEKVLVFPYRIYLVAGNTIEITANVLSIKT